MKVKVFRTPRLLLAALAQGRAILRGFWHLARVHWLTGVAALVLALGLGVMTLPHDPGLLRSLHFWNRELEAVAHDFSYFLGTWGDYPTYNVPLALAIWAYGVWKKSSAWRRAAVACFLGASLAGLFDDCFRLTLGRPRPDAHVPDGFYGFGYALNSSYQSFPSGHAACVFGTAVPLLLFNRWLGLAATLYALAVVWARMELYRHYPSDVVAGSLIGVYFGLMVGLGARDRRARGPRAASAPG